MKNEKYLSMDENGTLTDGKIKRYETTVSQNHRKKQHRSLINGR